MSHTFGGLSFGECEEMLQPRTPDIIPETIYRGR